MLDSNKSECFESFEEQNAHFKAKKWYRASVWNCWSQDYSPNRFIFACVVKYIHYPLLNKVLLLKLHSGRDHIRQTKALMQDSPLSCKLQTPVTITPQIKNKKGPYNVSLSWLYLLSLTNIVTVNSLAKKRIATSIDPIFSPVSKCNVSSKS